VRALHKAGLVVIDYILNEEPDWAKARSVRADKVLTDNPTAYKTWLASQ